MNDAAPAPRFPVGLTVAVAIAFLILIGLGSWQVQRMQWKEQLLARIAATQKLPARPLSEVLARAAAGEDVDFVRVSVKCLDPPLPQSRVLLYGLKDGAPVWRPIAPCRIATGGYGVIAIDRGTARDGGPNPPQLTIANPTHVEGVLRRPEATTAIQRLAGNAAQTDETGYFDRAAAQAAIAAQARTLTPPYMIVAERETPAPPFVTPAPLPLNISNRHVEYVITWYGLALALLGVYAAMLRRKLKRP